MENNNNQLNPQCTMCLKEDVCQYQKVLQTVYQATKHIAWNGEANNRNEIPIHMLSEAPYKDFIEIKISCLYFAAYPQTRILK